MSRDKEIYKKINDAVKILCDVYDLLNEKEEKIIDKENPNLISVGEFSKIYPTFTQGAIRNYIHVNLNNFNEKVTRRVGKRILINEKLFFEWVNDNE